MTTDTAADAEDGPYDLTNRYRETLTRIASATSRYRAGPSMPPIGARSNPVRLLAISKGQPAAAIRRLAELGQLEFGENYLQEALPKMATLQDLPLTWHYTGQIQGNKTRSIAAAFDWVHTVDRERVAQRLDEQRPAGRPPINVCIQVRLESEARKGGIQPSEVAALADRFTAFPRLRLRGLMCIPPPCERFDEQRAQFQRLADCLDELNGRGLCLDTLSMGMSQDMEAAIAAGATLVRIGTALFGARA